MLETNFSIVSVSIGLFLRAMNIDFANFSLSKEDFLPFFFTYIFFDPEKKYFLVGVGKKVGT